MSSDELPVAVAQFAPGIDTAANLAAIRSLAQRAVERGAQLVVFPEYSSFFTPELGQRAVAAAEPLDGPFVAGLEQIAGTVGATIVAGMLETTATPDRFSNTLVAVSGGEGVLAKYRKIHLYDAFGQRESDSVLAGAVEPPETFPVGGFTAGLQTCYDLRFPESTRRLVDAGVDLVLVPSEWVRGPLKEAHWRVLVTARAVENTVYVVAADQAPPIGAGNSMIVDPMGVEVATVGENTDVALAWASRHRVEQVRAINPALALRRFAVVPR